jgi:hypothetical protein
MSRQHGTARSVARARAGAASGGGRTQRPQLTTGVLTPAVGQGQVVVVHDRLGRAGGDRPHRDQRVPGHVQRRVLGVAVTARGVQQRALGGQPQVQLRVELRHPLMLSRIPAHSGVRASPPVTLGGG